MENLEKNIFQDNENNIVKEEVPCDNGTILEYHFDKNSEQTKRFFIKDKDGKILKFIDLELNDIDLLKEHHLNIIKDKFLKANIVLTESDLAKISQKLNKEIVDKVFTELDEEIDENADIEN
ncbi:MAG: hypothetical protein AAB696_00490 [Patescibacteria group bacterium]